MNKDSITIVLAEDDSDDVFICHEALKNTQFRCSIDLAKTGRELVDLLTLKEGHREHEKPKPDFVIIDINMPIMDGLEALKLLNDKGALEDVPVYVLSTSVNPEHRKLAAKLGAKKFFQKPNTMKEFEGIFNDIIQTL